MLEDLKEKFSVRLPTRKDSPGLGRVESKGKCYVSKDDDWSWRRRFQTVSQPEALRSSDLRLVCGIQEQRVSASQARPKR